MACLFNFSIKLTFGAMRPYLNWKTYSLLLALLVVVSAVYYFNILAKDIAKDEKVKVEILAESWLAITEQGNGNIRFVTYVNEKLIKKVPIIWTDADNTILDFNNLDSTEAAKDSTYLPRKLRTFKTLHPPVEIKMPFGKQYIYYGESVTLQRLKIYPLVLMALILVFIVVALISLSNAQRSMQNQLWVGMSKETAHQIGTPLSSIVAWMELLRENEDNKEWIDEMEKDIERLKLITERFSKIGSLPELSSENIVPRFEYMVDYMQRRAPKNVKISLAYNDDDIEVLLNGPLFDWVVENLIRNALDAMEGNGTINININNQPRLVTIDISDSGKGIPKNNYKKVFSPGFSTKQRGWGLGLSLAKRIVEKYHNGNIFVKNSDIGKGTTFRIILRR